MKITSWGNILFETCEIGYKVSGIYEGVEFQGEFWEDEDGLQENISFDKEIEDKYDAVLMIKEELTKFQYGG